MALITASAHPAGLWPGVKKWFGASYDEHAEEWRELLEFTTSDKRYEERVLSNGFPLAMEKPEGSPINFVSDSQGYTSRIRNIAFALGFQVTKEELDDNQYEDKAFDRASKLAFSMRITKEIVCANIYNRAYSASYVGGDGVSLINASHPTVSGLQSNALTPAADLSEQALEDLAIQIMKAKTFEGKQFSLMPDCVIIPPDEHFNACRILDSQLQPGTANNDVNVINYKGTYPGGAKVNHYLTDTDAFFIRTKLPKGTGMIYQERIKQEIEKDNEFTTKNAQCSAYMRFGTGWSDWKGLFGSAGA